MVSMVRSFVASIGLFCIVCPAVSWAEESKPDYRRIRSALQRSVAPTRFTVSGAPVLAMRPARLQRAGSAQRDSVWNGLLIGAGIGGVGGYIWARNICGSNDKECFYIAAPVGVLGGAGIGAAIGAIGDALNR